MICMEVDGMKRVEGDFAAGICCSMAEYVLLDMSGRERSKLVSILDYEWISIRHTKDARTADTSQFWNCREHWSVGT